MGTLSLGKPKEYVPRTAAGRAPQAFVPRPHVPSIPRPDADAPVIEEVADRHAEKLAFKPAEPTEVGEHRPKGHKKKRGESGFDDRKFRKNKNYLRDLAGR